MGRLLEKVARRSTAARSISNRLLYEFEPPPMRPETRARLVEEFAGDNEDLAQLLGWDLDSWRD
jgi:hypothetical protein